MISIDGWLLPLELAAVWHTSPLIHLTNGDRAMMVAHSQIRKLAESEQEENKKINITIEHCLRKGPFYHHLAAAVDAGLSFYYSQINSLSILHSFLLRFSYFPHFLFCFLRLVNSSEPSRPITISPSISEWTMESPKVVDMWERKTRVDTLATNRLLEC